LRFEELVPHSNQASVAEPLGLTLPFNIALVVPTEEAEEVDAVGGTGSGGGGGVLLVVKLCTDP
jgi:hypothetical protein